MPEVSAVQTRDVQSAIARASAATGVDFDYLLAQARIESDLDPRARAGTSSAAGLYQFIGSTWLETLDRHGANHGLNWASDAIQQAGGRARVSDPAMRSQIMGMRFDPDASALMAAELARDNAADLTGFLGREPDHAEMYLAHFMGSAGARSFLSALQDNPQASAASLFPGPAQANRGIFMDKGTPRSVAGVMDLLRSKVDRAKGLGGDMMPSDLMAPGLDWRNAAFDYAQASPAGAFAHAAATHATTTGGSVLPARRMAAISPEVASPARPSMADTLRATFGSGLNPDGGRAAQHVGEAYGKFRAFGL